MFVSLGSNCSVAYNLKKHGLREEAYPFDWCKVSINKLCGILENKFDNFSNIEIVKKSISHPLIESTNTGIGSYIIKNNYGIQFAHEVTNEYQLVSFSNCLDRRVSRFFELKNPIFVRIETTNLSEKQMNKYGRLLSILNTYFDNYKLILISKNKLSNDKVIWHHLTAFSSDWKYPNVDWKTIFSL